MIKKSLLLLFAATVTCWQSMNAQTDLIKATPLSPNAASLAKYIESPTGSFTGVPPISLPLVSIKASDIQINVAMNYHAGGNRVETVGSWVGMGWSLTGIPSISRQIKHIPDEGLGGFFFKPAPTETVKYISDNREQPGVNFYTLLSMVLDNVIDTEPDIFNFNLQNESGKFFYNQATESFNTFPKSNVKIVRTGTPYAAFTITDEQGITYYFDVLENSISQGSQSNPNPPTTSTWYPSKIISSTGKDTVFFEYSTENQVSRNNFGSTYLIPLDLDLGLLSWCDENNAKGELINNFATTYTYAKVPSKITYSLGSINFEKNAIEREDLEGGYTLKTVAWKDNADKVAKQYDFYYSYLSGNSTSDAMYAVSLPRERKYLLLDSLVEKGGTLSSKHGFKYNKQNTPTSRISTAQDEWGYYNGRTLNSTLRPRIYPKTYNLDGGAPAQYLTVGSDRSIDPLYNQFGMLQTILYPTGGRTDYAFESNQATQVSEGQLMGYYTTQSAAIEVADGETTNWPTTALYQTYFTVGNPKDKILNNNNNDGGALVKIEAGYFGCDLRNGSSLCAQIAIRSVSGTPTNINMPISANKPDNSTDIETYLPNGTYKIEASFNQTPAQYDNFYIMASWKSLDSSKLGVDPMVGGLRVKKISHYTSVNETVPSLETEYKYTMGLNSTKTSGEIFSSYSPIYSKRIETSRGSYQLLVAQPAFQTVLESGSCVGYKKVLSFTKSKDNTEQSATEISFVIAPDETLTIPPYVTLQNNQILRGKPDSIKTYNIKNGVARKVTEKTFEYEYIDTVTAGQRPYSLAVDHYRIDKPTPTIPVPWSSGLSIYNWMYDYPTYTFLLKKEKERTYDSQSGSTFLETVKEYTHNPGYFHVIQEKTTNSDQSVKKAVYSRPYDLRQSDIYYQQLFDKNQVDRVVKTETFNGTTLLETSRIKYNDFNGMTLPNEVYRKVMASADEKLIEFNQYNSKGNILEQRKANDVSECYIWDYKQTLPVAKVLNASPAAIAHTSFEADAFGGWTLDPGYSIQSNAGVTGTKSFNGTIRKTVPAGNYIVSLWVDINTVVNVNGSGGTAGWRNGNWELREWTFTNISQVIVTGGNIDEVRLYPAGAQMITYTFDPLVGMTSQCDINNRILYYEYDGLGRLKAVFDEKRNLLKKNDYQYQTTINQ